MPLSSTCIENDTELTKPQHIKGITCTFLHGRSLRVPHPFAARSLTQVGITKQTRPPETPKKTMPKTRNPLTFFSSFLPSFPFQNNLLRSFAPFPFFLFPIDRMSIFAPSKLLWRSGCSGPSGPRCRGASIYSICSSRRRKTLRLRSVGGLLLEIYSEDQDSSIFRQSSNPVCGSWKSQASSPWAKQHRD